ncbi:DUF4434 domain-containing protein [Leifsonia sp. C5G2]|uniref:DUF4434 domain-containing protein n=1 Tax=Leifsonia sp. C5G2 TaxID=2735269 RepID=UPI00158559FC|nr:DUF4434 domain-containing protein [Leifsonia sp. C5G2]NUU08110.1 DUF4434 domain-containing protein [Leifsonia sp. C5G2]
MSLTRILAALAMTAAAAGVFSAAPAHASARGEAPPDSRIPSSFISAATVADWDATRWSQEFRDLTAAGISTVVLNGAVARDTAAARAYYPTALPGVQQATSKGRSPVDAVTPLLTGARASGLTVWLGTYLPDSSWFSPDDATVSATTTANAAMTEAVIQDLDTRYGEFRDVIEGWYLGSEVNSNYAWSWNAGEALTSYYARLTAAAATASTAQKTMASPYYNVAALPNASLWTSMWTRILSAAPVTVLALQDGAGDCADGVCGPFRDAETQAQQLTTKFAATAAAVKAAGDRTALWSNADLYDGLGRSKPIPDLARDVETVRPYVSGYTSWSYTNQYSPWTLGTDVFHTPFAEWNTSAR